MPFGIPGRLEKTWHDFRRAYLPGHAGQAQREAVETAYFTGALASLSRLKNGRVPVTPELLEEIDLLILETEGRADPVSIGIAA